MAYKPQYPSICDACNKDILLTKRQLEQYVNHFCDRTCHAEWKRATKHFSPEARAVTTKYIITLLLGEKQCPRCKEVKPLDGFSNNKGRPDGLSVYCRECLHDDNTTPAMREYKRSYAEKIYKADQATANARQKDYREKNRSPYLRYQYGMTQNDYDLWFEKQNGVCRICGNAPPDGRNLHVDHDHATGVVRGLLCQTCNSMLGMAQDNVDILAAGIAYLTERK